MHETPDPLEISENTDEAREHPGKSRRQPDGPDPDAGKEHEEVGEADSAGHLHDAVEEGKKASPTPLRTPRVT